MDDISLQFAYHPSIFSYSSLQDPGDIEPYLKDESNFQGEATQIFFPRDQDELTELLYFSQKRSHPVTISANRTSLTGAAIPFTGDILSLEKMPEAPIHWNGNRCFMQAGMNYGLLQEEVNKQGFYLPVDPTSSPDCSIGGAVATNCSGSRSFKYGSLRNYVCYLEIMLPTGESLKLRRGQHYLTKNTIINSPLRREITPPLLNHHFINTVKNTTGYYNSKRLDLIDCFIGSEGTLGIVLTVGLELLRLPAQQLLLLVPVNRSDDVLRLWSSLKEKMKILLPEKLCAMDYIDAASCRLLSKTFDSKFIPEGGYFILELESKNTTEDLLLIFADFMEKEEFATEGILIGDELQTARRIRALRHEIPESINQIVRHQGRSKTAMDFSVPHESFPALFDKYLDLQSNSPFPVYIFGHIGEQNLHVNMLPAGKKEKQQASDIVKDIASWILDKGGTLSSEHGIGKTKRNLMKLAYTNNEYQRMKEFKLFWDPANILNRGNIFDE